MKKNKHFILFIGLILTSSIYSFIFLRNTQDIYTTGDLSFHLSRIKGLSTIFFSPINYETFNSVGYGVNYFYPYLTFLPATFLYWLTKNIIFSYIFYIWLLNLCTIVTAYHYGKKFLNQEKAAFLFSCFYTFSAYRTVDIYYRSAIAEGIAITLLIPVLFYSYQIIYDKKEKNLPIKLAISMSLLVYSHVLSTLMSTVLIAILIILRIFTKNFIKIDFFILGKKILSAVGITIILTCAFWYPLLEQMFYQKINKPSTTNLYAHTNNIFNSLMEALNNDLASYSMGLLGLLSLIIPLFFFNRLTRIERKIYYGAFLTWLATTSLIPWYILQSTPVTLLQFPWRLLSIQILFSSLILTMIFFKNKNMNKTKTIIYLIGILLLLITLTASSKKNFDQKIVSQPGHIVINKKTIGTYTTKGMDYFLYDYAPAASLTEKEHIANHEVKIGNKWEKSNYVADSLSITYKVKVDKRQDIILPVYAYRGTKVEINNKLIKTSINSNGLVKVKSINGIADIKISTNYTITTLISYFITLIAYILSLLKLFFFKQQV